VEGVTWIDRYRGERAWTYDAERCHSLRWAKEQCAVEDFAVTGPLLDVPCGTGRYFEIYQSRGLDFHGVDLSPDMLEVARRTYSEAKLTQGDIFSLPFRRQEFDTVVCTRLLDWFDPDEMQRAVACLRAVGRSLVVSIRHGRVEHQVNWTHSLASFYAAANGLYIDGRRITEVTDQGIEEIFRLRPPIWEDVVEQFVHHGHTPTYEMNRLARPWADLLKVPRPDYMSGAHRVSAEYWTGAEIGQVLVWMDARMRGYWTHETPRHNYGPMTIAKIEGHYVVLDGRRRGNLHKQSPDERFPVLVVS
jgi:SAM-dependent methyltransferase